MSRHISDAWRKLIAERAFYLCEYCLIHADDTAWTCPVDHIISLKHGGAHHPDNMAQACLICNRDKGADLGTILMSGDFARLFNPRKDKWWEHFELKNGLILPKTDIGEATVKVLGFNSTDRVLERRWLIEQGRYPHPDALGFMQP
ncbi:MAG: HNH endonuclease signature motif containing protein [Bacteroidota bacterium]